MKNTSFFPFERNRYFYGKLLSVEDFELEQRYVNDKRRILNRYLFGAGVIAGLNVVEVDEQTISLETGLALDCWGREITVDAPAVKKLSLLDGFDSCADEGTDFVYLCIEYGEKAVSPVHSITGRPDGGAGGDEEFGKVREGYRLYVTGEEPEERDLSSAAFYEKTVTICSESGICIRQVFPRFVKAGEAFDIRVEVENADRRSLSFSYEMELACLSAGGRERLTISFDEMAVEKKKKYELVYRLTASPTPGAEGSARVNEDGLKIFLDKTPVEVRAEGCSLVYLSGLDEKEELLRHYRRRPLEELEKKLGGQRLYLARIYLLKAGDACLIDRIDEIPFCQYVMGSRVSDALTALMRKEMLCMEKGEKGLSMGLQSEEKNQTRISMGRCEFDLEDGAPKGKRFFSEEIFHDLGPGKAQILLSAETDGEEVLFGDEKVFDSGHIQASLAARLNEEKGSFVVGIRLLETVTQGKLAIRWTALKSRKTEAEERTKMRIRIKPGLLELGLRESFCLEASAFAMSDKRVIWSVKDQEGAVDQYGCYTSPNIPGVYEVTARSAAYPEIKASIFVVVRDRNQAGIEADRKDGEDYGH